MTTIRYEGVDGEEKTLTNVRTTDESGSFLEVWHSDDAPDDMGWYDAQELNGYDEQQTRIPIDHIVRIDD